ncbi:GDSL-type esterase/lipase family protein [Ligilactobacillus salivarius]|uniref:GDSL-type esterase/lipase family protein n=1 Tax=Ligilactobacillus salivarius TaxID=1624 RepID=UPI0020236C28|nr:GDSL-type esterase/lipase family protein [Ligilactobacillus salivarius]URI12699.1 GDSL-type esterase/lipase family protein [Ligilactobacillus salivarius]UUB34524.1 GDSL-type esterase/lipase family protein [Ligilactobacillus salivarius]
MTNLVLFGDSITAGMTDGYPSPIFSNEIRKYFPNIEILNRGVPGDRTDLALSRIQADVLQSSPDIVTIFFGTNDVTDKGPDYQTFISNIKEMVTLIGIKKCILITPGITGTSLQTLYPNQKLSQYAQGIVALAEELNITYYDWHSVATKYETSTLLQTDDIHYSKKAYELLVQGLVPLIEAKDKISIENKEKDLLENQ